MRTKPSQVKKVKMGSISISLSLGGVQHRLLFADGAFLSAPDATSS